MSQTKTKTKAKAKTSSRSRPQSSAKKRTSSGAKRSGSSNGAGSASSNGGFVEKARRPAMAAGAALIALAGTAAARNSKRGRSRLPRPKLNLPRPGSVSLPKSGGSTIAWVGQKAKELGDAGYKVADLTSEAAKVEKTLRKG